MGAECCVVATIFGKCRHKQKKTKKKKKNRQRKSASDPVKGLKLPVLVLIVYVKTLMKFAIF